MQVLMFLLLVVPQGSAGSGSPDEDLRRTSVECAAFFSGVGANVARSDDEKQTARYLQDFMVTLAKESGISREEFQETWVAYQRELDRRAADHDSGHVQSQAERCNQFAVREAKKRDAGTRGDG